LSTYKATRDMKPEERREKRQQEKWEKYGRPRMFHDPSGGKKGIVKGGGKTYVKNHRTI